MRQIRFFLVHMPPATRAVVQAAAADAFPEFKLIEVGTLAEAGQWVDAGAPDLLVLAEPDEETAAQAIQAVAAGGLPRWAVVILGRAPSDVAETVAPAEWSPPVLARIFRSTLLQHELICENLCLRGDLKAVGHRISHDLRTPVGCIYTTSYLLKELAEKEPSAVGPLIQNIEESAAEISRMIDRVSFVLNASAEPSASFNFGMGSLVTHVLTELASDIARAGATVSQPPSWPEVTGVSSWLETIWRNLLENALKHGGPAPAIRLGWSLDAGGYRFSVEDRGPGVPAGAEAVLFYPFEQLHVRPTRGLGLSLVQRLVKLQGGRCGYARKDGSSEFYFTLPAATDTDRNEDQGTGQDGGDARSQDESGRLSAGGSELSP